jgi:hypothetical protein
VTIPKLRWYSWQGGCQYPYFKPTSYNAIATSDGRIILYRYAWLLINIKLILIYFLPHFLFDNEHAWAASSAREAEQAEASRCDNAKGRHRVCVLGTSSS